MTIKFSKDEQALIDDKLDTHSFAEFLVKNIGNQELNNRLYWKIEEQATLKEKQSEAPKLLTSGQIDNLKLLERWTYKTPTAQEIRSIANKIKIAKQLQEQGIELLPEEKISLLELKAISRFSLLLGKKDSFRDEESQQAKDFFKGTLQQIYKNSTNKEFKELYENMVICEELAADLRRDIFKSHTYKAHDILIRNEAKSAVIENVPQVGTTSLKEKDTVILFDKNIEDFKSYISEAFNEDWSYDRNKNSFEIEEKSESLKDYENAQEINFKPSSSAVTDISTINVTDILSSNIYRLPEEKLNDVNLMKQISEEQDPKKLEALLIANGAQKVPNSIAEEFVRTEDVKKSKAFNNIEDNLANTLEILAKSAQNQEEFVDQAKHRIEAYLAASNLQVSKKPDLTQNLGDYKKYAEIGNQSTEYLAQKNKITQELQNLYADRNKSGLKAEIIKFISSTLVTLGLKKSAAEKTIHAIRGKFTEKLSKAGEHGKGNNNIAH